MLLKDRERAVAEKWKKAYPGLGIWMVLAGVIIALFLIVAILGYL